MRTTIAQRDERFVPHVRAVVQGATVDFPNEDDVFHNVFSLSAAASQNGRGLTGPISLRRVAPVTFVKPGLVQVFCHIHADKSAFVWVSTCTWCSLATIIVL
jgi:plastocyanin